MLKSKFRILAHFILQTSAFSLSVVAGDYFVSPNGTGNGATTNTPSSFRRACAVGAVSPGNTVWLLNGVYYGPFTNRMQGTPQQRIVIRQLPGARAIFDTPPPLEPIPPTGTPWKVAPMTLNQLGGGYVDYIGLEIRWSYPGRPVSTSRQDRMRPGSLDLQGPFCRAINNLIYDTGIGIGTWEGAPNAHVYGNVIVNVGWQDSAEGIGFPPGQGGTGPGLYGQNKVGQTLIQDNICWGGFGYGLHAYTDGSEVWNFTFDHNYVASVGGQSEGMRYKPAFFIGGGNGVRNARFVGNWAFTPLDAEGFNYQLWWGSKMNQDLVFESNVSIGSKNGWGVENYQEARFFRNRVYCTQRPARYANVSVGEFLDNEYYGSQQFRYGGTITGWNDWQATVGEHSSTYSPSAPPQNWIEVRPNQFEQGRANIAVANFQGLASVEVEVPQLQVGQVYVLRNVADWFNPVASGTYSGKLLVPLKGLRTTAPIGAVNRIIPQSLFNLFVVQRAGTPVIVPTGPEPPMPPIIPPITPIPTPTNTTGIVYVTNTVDRWMTNTVTVMHTVPVWFTNTITVTNSGPMTSLNLGIREDGTLYLRP